LNKTTEYSQILERMSLIRIAIQILDDLPNDCDEDQKHRNDIIDLQGKTKADVAKLLLQIQYERKLIEEGRK